MMLMVLKVMVMFKLFSDCQTSPEHIHMVDPLENLVVDSLLLSALPFQTSLKMQNLVKDTVSQFLAALAALYLTLVSESVSQ